MGGDIRDDHDDRDDEQELNIEIGKRIRKKRNSKKLSQEKLAFAINVSKQTISLIERGRQEPGSHLIIKIAKMLETSTDYLLTGEVTYADISISRKKYTDFNKRRINNLGETVRSLNDLIDMLDETTD